MAFTVIAPVTNEKLIKGQPYTIKWSTTSTSKPITDSVKIYIRLLTDLTVTVETITLETPSSTGSFTWTPQVLYTNASIWVREVSLTNATEYIAKSGYFNIEEGVTVVLKPREFRCVLTNTAGQTISNTAKLTVNP